MSSHSAPAPLSPAWWVRGRDGRITVAQAPNPAIAVWLATVVLGWTGVPGDATERQVHDIGTGALIVWGLDELVRGASPFRRLLGALVLAFQLARLLT